MLIQIAVLTVFSNHCFKFRGRIYRQSRGGAIGLRLTSVVARIVMDTWACKFLFKLDTAGMRIFAFMKYVDDVNVVMRRLKAGFRWTGEKLAWTKECQEEQRASGESEERLTMTRVLEAAESIYPWLKFTMDLAEDHGARTVPMLDLQVWTEPMKSRQGSTTAEPEGCRGGEGPQPGQDPAETDDGVQVLSWAFYEKPSTSSKVLRANSAYPWRSKLVTMVMEVFRRCRNTSRQLAPESRAKILGTFVSKMRRSGYHQSTVDGVLDSGLRFYYRKVKLDLEGGPPLNHRVERDTVQRRREKMGATKDWFKRRRGGEQEARRKEDPARVAQPRSRKRRPGVRPGVGAGTLGSGAPPRTPRHQQREPQRSRPGPMT